MRPPLFLLLSLCVFSSCSTTKTVKPYIESDQVVGIIFKNHDFEIRKKRTVAGTSPLAWIVNAGLSTALNSTKDKLHQEVQDEILKQHPSLLEDIIVEIKDFHDSKNISYKMLDLQFQDLELKEHEPTLMKRKQAKFDYRPIGEKYDVDYLHIVEIQNFIELDGLQKRIRFIVKPIVVNMEDNSFMHLSRFGHGFTIIGKWRDSPNHPKLMHMVKDNIDLTFEQFDKKYRPYYYKF